MPQGVEGKVPDVGILQQAVIVILESFLLKVVSKLVGDDEAIVGVRSLFRRCTAKRIVYTKDACLCRCIA